jgi:2-keto-4-pentenoate hydratase/2-oxohepta-3-ene-1,7-dioic acid hydratase in catechol pathway
VRNQSPRGDTALSAYFYTGIVPDSSFTLESGDRIRITIEPIGTLENEVA